MSSEDSIKLMALKDYYKDLQGYYESLKGRTKPSPETLVRSTLAEYSVSLSVMREFIEWAIKQKKKEEEE